MCVCVFFHYIGTRGTIQAKSFCDITRVEVCRFLLGNNINKKVMFDLIRKRFEKIWGSSLAQLKTKKVAEPKAGLATKSSAKRQSA